MRPPIGWVSRAYAALLGCYPHDFRVGFAEEMRSVFAEAYQEALRRGWRGIAALCWRELRDWPRALVSAYWSNLKENAWRHVMSEISLEKEGKEMTPRGALLAALPPLLIGLGIALSALIVWEPWNLVPRWRLILGVAIGLLPAVAVAVGGFIALLRRLPDWGYTWAGASAMGVVILFKTLVEEQADFGKALITPEVDLAIGIVLLLGITALLAVTALRGWRGAGLLSIGFGTVFGVTLYSALLAAPFNRHDLALLAAPAGLLSGLLTYLYCRGSDGTRALTLFGIAIVNGAALWVAHGVWQPWLAAHDLPSPVFPMLVVLVGALTCGPLLGLMTAPLRRSFNGT
jgi:hypothetical protein